MSDTSNPELLYQIALTMASAIGPVTARKLILEAGSAREVFRMNRASLEKIPGIGPQLSQSIHEPTLLPKAEKEIVFLEKHHITALFLNDSEYPYRLKECKDAPILLYACGTKGLNTRRALSVVGTRRASSYGKELCRKIVTELGTMIDDLSIISGLAYGIDVIAHRAALKAAIPTVAVLGHGLDTIYPYAHRDTAIRISKHGAVLTDFNTGVGPERNNFLRRNRLIAGMADATLVVESARSGGALITAAMASSYGRDVLSVPGRVSDERSKGCNNLIKGNVAGLVESAKDVVGQLNWHADVIANTGHNVERNDLTRQERLLMELIVNNNGLRPGELSTLSGIPVHTVLSQLTRMELKQWVYMEPGNLYQSRIDLD